MLRLSLVLVFVAAVQGDRRNPSKPAAGFKRSFISPNDVYVRKWSSTGMTGLDHADPIDDVDLASEKTVKKDSVTEGKCLRRKFAKVGVRKESLML